MRAHRLPQFRSSHHTIDCRAEFLRISGRHDVTVPTVVDQVGRTPRNTAYDDRKPARHRFIHYQTPRVTVRRKRQAFRESIYTGQIFPLTESKKTNYPRPNPFPPMPHSPSAAAI